MSWGDIITAVPTERDLAAGAGERFRDADDSKVISEGRQTGPLKVPKLLEVQFDLAIRGRSKIGRKLDAGSHRDAMRKAYQAIIDWTNEQDVPDYYEVLFKGVQDNIGVLRQQLTEALAGAITTPSSSPVPVTPAKNRGGILRRTMPSVNGDTMMNARGGILRR